MATSSTAKFGDPATPALIDPFEGPVWTKPVLWQIPLTYPKNGYGDGSFGNLGYYPALITEAFNMWKAVSGIDLTKATQQQKEDIDVALNTKLLSESPTGTGLGVTHNVGTIPGTAMTSPVTIELQDPQLLVTSTSMDDTDALIKIPPTATVPNPQLTTFFNVVAHEIGHALGLAHNPSDPFSIMYEPAANDPDAANLANLSIDANDVAALQKLYPVTTPIEQMFFQLNSSAKTDTISSDNSINEGAVPAALFYDDTPFSPINFSDIIGLGMDIQITYSGTGILSDPEADSYASFSNGVFDERFLNLTTSSLAFKDASGNNRTDYTDTVLKRILFTPDQTQNETNVFHLKITDSIGRVETSDVTVTTQIVNPGTNKPVTATKESTADPFLTDTAAAAIPVTPTPTPTTPTVPVTPTPTPPIATLTPAATISAGLLAGNVSTSMQFLQSNSTFISDTKNLETANTASTISNSLEALLSEAHDLGFAITFSPQSNNVTSSFVITDQSQTPLVGVNFTGVNTNSGVMDTLLGYQFPSSTPVA